MRVGSVVKRHAARGRLKPHDGKEGPGRSKRGLEGPSQDGRQPAKLRAVLSVVRALTSWRAAKQGEEATLYARSHLAGSPPSQGTRWSPMHSEPLVQPGPASPQPEISRYCVSFRFSLRSARVCDPCVIPWCLLGHGVG
jgi:hypothetical protein